MLLAFVTLGAGSILVRNRLLAGVAPLASWSSPSPGRSQLPRESPGFLCRVHVSPGSWKSKWPPFPKLGFAGGQALLALPAHN